MGIMRRVHLWEFYETAKCNKKILTDSCVADECFLVLEHRIHGDFLAILRSDDGDGRLLVRGNCRHLFNNFNLFVFVMDSGE